MENVREHLKEVVSRYEDQAFKALLHVNFIRARADDIFEGTDKFVQHVYISTYSGVIVSMDYDIDTYKAMRRRLKDFRRVRSSYDEESATTHVYFASKSCTDLSIKFEMTALSPDTGSKCHWVQTGTKEVPVYKVVCDE